jgi:hypothetical protein
MEPDASENRIRFGCGFTFGLIAGFFSAITHIYDTWGPIISISLFAALVCGWLAKKYGDAFWYSIKNWWFWT